MRVAFIGLGKLGMPVAEAMADAHDVQGYDKAVRVSDKISIFADMKDAIRGAELIFVAVPTPHDPEYDGSVPSSDNESKDFDYSAVQDVLGKLATRVRTGQTIVLISTCLPGTCRSYFEGMIPPGVELLYNPYFIAMGTVAADFVNPEFMIIGTRSGETTAGVERLVECYEPLMPGFKRFIGTWTEAEAVKMFYNTFITFKLCFVNMIQDVAQAQGDMNVDRVTVPLSHATKRLLSPMYMKAGMGDGGGCHPRDNIALSFLADHCNIGYDIFGSLMHAREQQATNIADYLLDRAHEIGTHTVVIVGKAFKPGVDLTDGSYSLLIAYYLEADDLAVLYHDHLTGDFADVDEPVVYLLAHPYDKIDPGLEFVDGSIVVDPWRTMPDHDGLTVIHYGNTRGTVESGL